MNIILNGEPYKTKGAATLGALLEELGIDALRVAVELNLQILKKNQYYDYHIQEGDTIEIVNFVGGG